jgi:hypothetical protein
MMRAGLRTRKIAYTGFSTQLSLKGYKSFVNILIDSFRKTFFACLSSSMCQLDDQVIKEQVRSHGAWYRQVARGDPPTQIIAMQISMPTKTMSLN